VRGHSDSGNVKIDIPDSPTGAHLLDLNSDSGSIRVNEGDAAAVPPSQAAPSASATPSASPSVSASAK
jgi:hypothetical protein